MLGLKATTNPGWVENAVLHTNEILIDHAHCEKKAAAFAMALIQRYPKRSRLVTDMIAIAKEELEHFDLVFQYILKRGLLLTIDRGNYYAKQLHEHISHNEPLRLLDSLLVGALIEARSCERFSLLSEKIEDVELRLLYSSLLASEAGHYRAYTDIAREYFPVAQVKVRLMEFCEIEAEIVRKLPGYETMHG
jgi:tRNA-(ms[2]io[6]A)-hydroxylase